MDHPWPENHASEQLFEEALAASWEAQLIQDMSVRKVGNHVLFASMHADLHPSSSHSMSFTLPIQLPTWHTIALVARKIIRGLLMMQPMWLWGMQVATTLHRLEQAKYWAGLKQRHSNPNLAAKQRSAIEGQMADCMRSTAAAPAKELVAMVQAGCEDEVQPLV